MITNRNALENDKVQYRVEGKDQLLRKFLVKLSVVSVKDKSSGILKISLLH